MTWTVKHSGRTMDCVRGVWTDWSRRLVLEMMATDNFLLLRILIIYKR